MEWQPEVPDAEPWVNTQRWTNQDRKRALFFLKNDTKYPWIFSDGYRVRPGDGRNVLGNKEEAQNFFCLQYNDPIIGWFTINVKFTPLSMDSGDVNLSSLYNVAVTMLFPGGYAAPKTVISNSDITVQITSAALGTPGGNE